MSKRPSQNQERDLLDEVLHFVLQTPPLEFDCDQFVRAHVGAVFLGMELLLQALTREDGISDASTMLTLKT